MLVLFFICNVFDWLPRHWLHKRLRRTCLCQQSPWLLQQLIYAVSNGLLKKFWTVQNSAACIVAGTTVLRLCNTYPVPDTVKFGWPGLHSLWSTTASWFFAAPGRRHLRSPTPWNCWLAEVNKNCQRCMTVRSIFCNSLPADLKLSACSVQTFAWKLKLNSVFICQ